jgi:hypothetical protein
MKKLGLFIAFFSLFAIGLSAQAPAKPAAKAPAATGAKAVPNKKQAEKMTCKKPVASATPRKNIQPVQKKIATAKPAQK